MYKQSRGLKRKKRLCPFFSASNIRSELVMKGEEVMGVGGTCFIQIQSFLVI